jgi:hypothetical protein
MMIKTRVFDEFGVARLQCITEIDSASVMETAHTVIRAYRKMDVLWLLELLGAQGQDLVELMRANVADGRRTVILTEISATAFLVDTLFGGVSPSAFLSSDLSFVIAHDNAITFQKLDGTCASRDTENTKCELVDDGGNRLAGSG